ncbi:MAG: hypothetical protein WCT53_05950 [Candidatus Gracilibacteria bacterium]
MPGEMQQRDVPHVETKVATTQPDTSFEVSEAQVFKPDEATGMSMDAGQKLVQGAMGKLDAMSPREAKEKPVEIPTLAQQLDVMLALGRKASYEANTREQKSQVWEATLGAVNEFRKAYGGLPPIQEASPTYSIWINDSINQGRDGQYILNIFKKEKAERGTPSYIKHVEQLKRTVGTIPGVNFVVGAGAGAIELVGGAGTLAGEGLKAAGVGANETEQQESQRVLVAVAASFKDLGHLASVLLRTEEYKESIAKDGGETTGFIMGKHYFDVASALLGGHALQGALGIGASGGKMAAEAGSAAARTAAEAGEVGIQAVGKEALAATAVAGATVVGTEAFEGIGGGGLKGVIRRFAAKVGEEAAPTAKEAMREVAREAPKEGAKEAAKGSGHTKHKLEMGAHGAAHEETAQAEGAPAGKKHG